MSFGLYSVLFAVSYYFSIVYCLSIAIAIVCMASAPIIPTSTCTDLPPLIVGSAVRNFAGSLSFYNDSSIQIFICINSISTNDVAFA